MKLAPKRLRKEGKYAWKESLKWLESKGMIEDVDYPLLESMCFAIDMMQNAMDEIYKDGIIKEHTNKAESTNLQTHPAVTIYKHFHDILDKCAKNFGFNPLARKSFLIIEEDKNPMMDLLNGTGVDASLIKSK